MLPINVKRAIIHVLDKESSEPMLNEFELDIDGDVRYFLEKHITRLWEMMRQERRFLKTAGILLKKCAEDFYGQ